MNHPTQELQMTSIVNRSQSPFFRRNKDTIHSIRSDKKIITNDERMYMKEEIREI
jgi:hypothetical protein